MDNYTFPLVKDLRIPYSGAQGALVLFPKELFKLVYEAIHRPKLRQIEVNIFVSPIAVPDQQSPIKSFTITEDGFETTSLSNEKELMEWKSARDFCSEEDSRLRVEIEATYLAQKQFDQNTQEWRDLSAQIAALEPKLADNQRKFQEILSNPVFPQYIRVNKYQDTASFFVEGELTKEGLEWAKNIPFAEGKIGDYIE